MAHIRAYEFLRWHICIYFLLSQDVCNAIDFGVCTYEPRSGMIWQFCSVVLEAITSE